MSIAELQSTGSVALEGAASLLLFVFANKIYRAKVSTHIGCCGDKFVVDTPNPGADTPEPWGGKNEKVARCWNSLLVIYKGDTRNTNNGRTTCILRGCAPHRCGGKL